MTLILKRASASRPSGEWNDDEFDVRVGGGKEGARGKKGMNTYLIREG
jgi:hypothetical protein